MKPGYFRIILFLLASCALLATSGCIIREDRGWHGHDRGYYYHDRYDHPRDRDWDRDDYYRER